MSLQQSELPIRTNGDANAPRATDNHHSSTNGNTASTRAHPGKIAIEKRGSFEIDPFASPAIYYGEDQAPRKIHKTRTLSAVSPPHGPQGHTPRTPRSPHAHERRWSLPNRTQWLIEHGAQIEPSIKNPAASVATGRRTSHGRLKLRIRYGCVLTYDR